MIGWHHKTAYGVGMKVSTVERLERLEQSSRFARVADRPRRYVAQGPVGFDAYAFLRSCGHDVRDHDIVLVIVGAEDGRPVDLPLADLTDAPADPLH